MTLFKIITYLGYLILLINMFNYLKSSVFKKTRAFRVFSFYLAVIVVIQIISKVHHFYKIDNLFISHYYFIIQFILLSIYFYNIIKSEKLKNIIVFISSTTLLSIIIQYLTTSITYNSFNLYEVVMCSLPLVLYSVFFFFQKLDSKDKKYIYINSGIFIYLLSSTLIFSSGNLMPDLPKKINRIIWHANVFLYLIYQILIFVEWYKHFRKKEVSS